MGYEIINQTRVNLNVPGLPRCVPVIKKIFMTDEDDKLWIGLDPNTFLETPVRNAVKAMMQDFEGRKYFNIKFKGPEWYPHEDHFYGFPLTSRNEFLLKFVEGGNPYEPWERELEDIAPSRDCLYDHQKRMFNFMLQRRYTVIAAEMGTGKSLSVLECLEYLRKHEGLKNDEIWYVAPVAGVRAIELEFKKWNSPVRPTRVMTYDKMRTTMRLWENGDPAPKAVVFDESSKLKTWTTKRTRAAFKLAEAVRAEHGMKGFVTLMSGTPAPKTPEDWWAQAEIARPGFLAESSVEKFRNRLCIREQREGMAGGSYNHIVTFLDDTMKCRCCGQYEDHINHQKNYPSEVLTKIPEVWPPVLKYGEEMPHIGTHQWEPSKNEVEFLSKRLDGLAQVTYKKDCLDLPDKQYRIVRVKPATETMQAFRILKKKARSAAVALCKARELSDGFNYVMEETGEMVSCKICNGTGKVLSLEKSEDDSEIEEAEVTGIWKPNIQMTGYHEAEVDCDACGGSGEVPQIKRGIAEVECPKDEVLKEYLAEQEDIGRMVVWGAFTGTLDRLTTICNAQGWNVLRIEGSGWSVKMADPNEPAPSTETALKCLDASWPQANELRRQYEKFVVVGNPLAGGMGLTLTAAQVAVYYSNPFSGEARIQSEDRIHRTGMDKNRAPIIVDIVHLPTDKLVIDNLKKKRRLLDMSLGEMISQIDMAQEEILIHEQKEG
jgi:SNF2 family DNA or RNA helicase